MSDPFIAQIVMFAGNFAPRDWALCDGQLLAISSNTALFSLLGTTYGGDGMTTFALPDLRGRVPMHPGNGPGLSSRTLGDRSGDETATLSTANLPSHSHTIDSVNGGGNATGPVGAYAAEANEDIYSTDSPDSQMQPTGNTGSGQPVDIVQPFTCVNFIIALTGVFPSRN